MTDKLADWTGLGYLRIKFRVCFGISLTFEKLQSFS